MHTTLFLFLLAAFAEIGGCFAFWAHVRLGLSIWWLLPGTILLIFFAWLLTQTEPAFAGRAYAAYGGIYIIASLLWLWGVEGVRPSRWDLGGTAFALLGALIILFGNAASAR